MAAASLTTPCFMRDAICSCIPAMLRPLRSLKRFIEVCMQCLWLRVRRKPKVHRRVVARVGQEHIC